MSHSIHTNTIAIIVLIFCTSFSYAPSSSIHKDDWIFEKEKYGIRVYTRNRTDSKLKELKMTFDLSANLSTTMAALQDVQAFPIWIYKCKEARRISKNSYYTILDFPWPLNDRDAVSQVSFKQDTKTKVIYTRNVAAPSLMSYSDDHVRIEQMEVKWQITPVDHRHSQVVYTLQTDPGGNIPKWLVNQAIDNGPVKSIVAFRELLQQEKYQGVSVAGVVDY